MGVAVVVVLACGLIASMLLIIEFPSLIPAVVSAGDALIFYISKSLPIVWVFLPKTATLSIGGIAISVELIVIGYHFVMWILRKVPVASIE